MKKYFLCLVLSFIFLSLFSAQNESSIQRVGYIYSEILLTPKVFSTSQYNIYMDLGSDPDILNMNKSGGSTADNTNNFISVVDAINYMAKDGWEVYQVISIPRGEAPGLVKYLLRKKVIWQSEQD